MRPIAYKWGYKSLTRDVKWTKVFVKVIKNDHTKRIGDDGEVVEVINDEVDDNDQKYDEEFK